MKVISYSIFGAGEQMNDSNTFKSYLRGLEINLRVAEVLYPDWNVCWSLDIGTFNSEYRHFFDYHNSNRDVRLHIRDKAALCEMMLWRMLPAFDKKVERFICRDTDSLITYRDANAVKYWENGGKVALALTDSVSHNVALMGGMVGFQSGYLRDRLGVKTFEDMLALQPMPYDKKGSDQDFLNRVVLPKVGDSITEFYVLGLPQSFRGDCHNMIPDLEAAPDYCKELDGYGYHLGAAGFSESAVLRWLEKYGKNKEMYKEIEDQYKHVFYWRLE